MTVYLDALFLVNALLNFLLLRAAAQFAAAPVAYGRLILGAVFGGAYAAAAALPNLLVLTNAVFKALFGAGMLLIAYGIGRGKLRLYVWFFLLSACFAGVLLVITKAFGAEVYVVGGTAVYPISFGTLVLVAGVSYCAVSLLLRGMGKRSVLAEIRPITICVRGKKARFTALMDTGNALRDPLTGRQVLVLDGTQAASILPELRPSDLQHPAETFALLSSKVTGLRLLPYRAVGTTSGLMLAIRSDWVLLGNRKLQKILVAFSPSPVSDGSYQVIAGGQ